MPKAYHFTFPQLHLPPLLLGPTLVTFTATDNDSSEDENVSKSKNALHLAHVVQLSNQSALL